MNLVQAQRRFIEKMKPALREHNKRQAVGARLELCRWAKRNGCDPIVVLNDARDVLELERNAE